MAYADDVRIDPDQLDIEWLRQADLYRKYSELSVQANDRLRKADQKLKMVRSELILEATEKGEEVLGKGVKATAPVVEAFYRCHPRHTECKEEWLQASYDAEMYQNALFALQQKKAALESLVKLLAANYFATPTEPRSLNREWQERTEEKKDQQQAETTERMRRRRTI